MNTLVMGYKKALNTAVQFEQESKQWSVIKHSNADAPIFVDTNKFIRVGTFLPSVSITAEELKQMLSGLLDAYDMLIDAAYAQVPDPEDWRAILLPGEVERFSKPNPQLSFPTQMKNIPIQMYYMGQSWRFDTINKYWWPWDVKLDLSSANTPPVFKYPDSISQDDIINLSGEALVAMAAQLINDFTTLGTDKKATVYSFVMMGGTI